MPPYPLELEAWWLTDGHRALQQLVDRNDIRISPSDCGYAQALQNRLMGFDKDRHLQFDLRESLPKIRLQKGIAFEQNPRKSLVLAAKLIFRSPEDGGMNHTRSMEGIGLVDAMETHRLRLLKYTFKMLQVDKSLSHHKQIIDELHRASSHNYEQFHLGFRAGVSWQPQHIFTLLLPPEFCH